jgi:hypothetical protein
MGRTNYTGLLYSQPTILQGFARTLDIGGTFDSYNVSTTPAEADWMALASDWYAVSEDFLRAMEAYKASRSDGC